VGDVKNIRPDQWFSTCDDQQTTFVDLSNLVDEPETFFSGQFVITPSGFGCRIKVTMVAFEVTTLGEVQGNEIGLEIINGSAVEWSIALRHGREKFGDWLLNRASRSCGRSAVENRERLAHAYEC